MAGLELTEFVLLVCDFQVLGGDDDADEDASEDANADANEIEETDREEPTQKEVEDESVWRRLKLEGVELRYSADVEEDEFILLVHVALTDPTAPYSLHVVTGSRFTIPDEPEVSVEEAEPTLVFITYPYLREVVANITSRSPYREFTLPPLTRLPHPRVRGDEEQGESNELH